MRVIAAFDMGAVLEHMAKGEKAIVAMVDEDDLVIRIGATGRPYGGAK